MFNFEKFYFINRKYTLEKMFASQLLECAKDELSFRTVVRDLKTKSPILQIVLINTNFWSCTGDCLAKEGKEEPVPKIDLHPVIKVLFSQCSSSTDSQIRLVYHFSLCLEEFFIIFEVYLENCC